MKNREQLHQLIHKLSKSEKRAFKLYVKKYDVKKDQKVVQLFDLFNKMPEYDEEKLLAEFSNSQLAYHSHKLKNYLLNSLSDLHFKNNIKSPGEIIKRIELGFKYDNLAIIEESIKKGFEVAEQEDNTPLKLYLLSYQQKLSYTQRDMVSKAEVDKKIINQTSQWNQSTLYELMWDEAYLWKWRNKHKQNIEPLQFSNQRMTNIFNAPIDENASFEEKFLYLKIKDLYYNGIGNSFEELIETTEQIYEIHLAYKKPIPLHILFNIVLFYLRLNKFEKAEQKLKQAGILKNNHEVDLSQSNQLPLHIELLNLYFFYQKDYQSILAMEAHIEELFNADSGLIKMRISDYEQLSLFFIVSCFKVKQYKKCLDWLIRIKQLNTKPTKKKSATATLYQFIELCIHIELGNTKILDSLIKAIDYSVKVKQTISTDEDNEMIRVIKAIIKRKKVAINTAVFGKDGPFSHYEILYPYLEEKQKELDK